MPQKKLTKYDIIDIFIRRKTSTAKAIAEEFGVSEHTVYSIWLQRRHERKTRRYANLDPANDLDPSVVIEAVNYATINGVTAAATYFGCDPYFIERAMYYENQRKNFT